MELVSIRFMLKHNDWSEITKNNTIKLTNASVSYVYKDLYSHNILLLAGNHSSRMSFYRFLLRKSECYNIKNLESNKNVTAIGFYGLFKPSNYSIFQKFGCINEKCNFYDGIEDWTVSFITDISIFLNEMVNELRESNDIVKALTKPLDLTGNALLTQKEFRIIEYAYENGFFDVPKNVNVTDLADHFGVSKAYISKVIRSATFKLILEQL